MLREFFKRTHCDNLSFYWNPGSAPLWSVCQKGVENIWTRLQLKGVADINRKTNEEDFNKTSLKRIIISLV